MKLNPFVAALLLLVGTMLAIGVARTVIKSAAPDIYTTTEYRADYIKSCSSTGEVSAAVCECMLDQLLTIHPDFMTNDDLNARVVADGHTDAEKAEMVKCL